MTEHTPRPWPAGTMPTAIQLLEWLRAATDDEALPLLAASLEDAQLAHRCRVSDHDAGMVELSRATYDRARWLIVRDHVQATNATDPTARKVRELMGEDDTP